jgi:hypothetical protein
VFGTAVDPSQLLSLTTLSSVASAFVVDPAALRGYGVAQERGS